MLNVKEQFLSDFANLSKAEQEQKVNTELSVEEIDILSEAGYVIEVNNGKSEIKEFPEK